MRNLKEVRVPKSRMVESIVKILEQENLIEGFTVASETTGNQAELVVNLKYNEDGSSVISKLIRVSKPGLRVYTGYKDIKPVLNNMGIGIFSTPKGILTNKQAIAEKVGGEYLCQIW